MLYKFTSTFDDLFRTNVKNMPTTSKGCVEFPL